MAEAAADFGSIAEATVFLEYPAVVTPVMTQHYTMLQRNLLYTGVTRGKKLVVLVESKTPPARLLPLPQQVERVGRQHDIAVLAALGLLDPNDLLRAVNVLDLQPDHLAGGQAAAIAETEQHAHLGLLATASSLKVSSWLITSGIFCGSRR
jgi:hypothetical protein